MKMRVERSSLEKLFCFSTPTDQTNFSSDWKMTNFFHYFQDCAGTLAKLLISLAFQAKLTKLVKRHKKP